MRYGKLMILAATLLGPAMAWAGEEPVASAPTLGDAGLIALGIGLVGTGLALLRKR